MTDADIRVVPRVPDYVRFADGFGQRFILTVDAEEEFDWAAPLSRDRHSLTTVPALQKFQQFCEGNGVCPVYLLDWPVANSAAAREALGDAVAAGRAEIGVQLHPWVNPPHDEEIGERNSYAGNLPAALEREKFARLRELIETNFGAAPRIYRAGRYGAGAATAAMLAEFGVAVDSSVRARFDYSATGGPNYRDHPVAPYWLDRQAGLFEMPLTTVYWGLLRQLGPTLFPALWRAPRLRGALARIGMLERIALTPEGITAEEAIRGIDIAADSALPLLVFSFHSPSLVPGFAPYVRDDAGLDAFYDWWRDIFAALTRLRIRPASLTETIAAATLASPPSTS